MIKTPRAPYVILSAALTSSLAWSQGCTVRYYFYSAESGTASGSGGMGGTGGGGLCSAGETRSCYDGPEGTEGKGICKAGFETCAADGMSWGACEGAVKPLAENCATPEDEDCDGKAPPCGGECFWSERFGDGSPLQAGVSIAVDGAGNSILTGYMVGQADFGGGPLNSGGLKDVFLAKLDQSGKHLWSRRFGDGGDQVGSSVAVDSLGNVLLTGYLGDGQADFGGGALIGAGFKDVFLAKFDPSGNHLWSKRFSDVNENNVIRVAVDGADNVLLTGYFEGATDFGGGPLISAGLADVFLVKFDPSGNHLWSKRFGDESDQGAYGIAVDSGGNVLLTGILEGQADFGGGLLTSAGLLDVFLVKFDPDGNHLWSKSFGDAGEQAGNALAVDSANNVLVTGYLEDQTDFGGGPLLGKGAKDVFLVKLDPSGNHLWSKSFGDASTQNGTGIGVDGADNVLLVGVINGKTDFGGGPIASAGKQDVFLAKFDFSGAHVWSKRFGDGSDQNAAGLTVDKAHNVILTGFIYGQTDFGCGPIASAGDKDIFLTKISP